MTIINDDKNHPCKRKFLQEDRSGNYKFVFQKTSIDKISCCRKNEVFVKDFFSKCDQICNFMRI